MEQTDEMNKSYCIPHLAVHSGSRTETLPLDVQSLIEEVIREYPIQYPRMRLPQRLQNETAGQRNMARNLVETGGQNEGDDPPRPAEISSSDKKAMRPADSADLESTIMEKELFRRNRAQLFHPPVHRTPSRLKLAAGALTILVVLIGFYVLYVGKALNFILPPSLQYERPSLELQLHRTGSADARSFDRQFYNPG